MPNLAMDDVSLFEALDRVLRAAPEETEPQSDTPQHQSEALDSTVLLLA